MNVDATTNPYGQMQYGGAQGQGQNGMKDIMQNLSNEDRATLRDKMQSLPTEDRVAMKDQLKSVDQTEQSSDDYFQTLLDMFTQTDPAEEATGFSVYA